MRDAMTDFLEANHKKVDIPFGVVQDVQAALGVERSAEAVDWYRRARGYSFPWGFLLEYEEEGHLRWGICLVSTMMEFRHANRSVFAANLAVEELLTPLWANYVATQGVCDLVADHGGVYCAFGWICETDNNEVCRRELGEFLEAHIEDVLAQVHP